jgi:phage gpG-like protein
MSASLTIKHDGISPDLLRKARAAANKTPFLKAMGTAAVTLGKQAFTDAGLRPSAWAPRKDTSTDHNLLMLSTMLYRSPRITRITASQVTIGSDRPYAATHQLGSEKLNIPPRPFLPFRPSGALTKEGATRVERALRAALNARGL